ncbi:MULTISPECIES: DUF2225 domain-containing protein [Lysinibacillus]|uniref:DUF2225 domain-containing protein n=1 Tax=Lysinibacillus boronitolerans JCM 21713 = 10a = NBRC 103108 TaxID=1294264 RepID=A0ABR4XYJ8_9BACI|nr:DUF2225 domain-containing protein [Lysinibacillus boronitolerans]KGR83559.1 hypothetical protein CD31_15180 [Lysinibacillus boronitolerans JCM 21713 = 10a = NBRC 103108]MCS1392934.1 DUF2225 domain-containing protein [Lysinibacillus boronitolerans]
MEISPYYEKKIQCLNCKKEFPTLKVRSKFIKVDHTETDFQPIYADEVNALYYNVFVCEHCGFSFTEDFTKYFAPGIQDHIRTQITEKWVHHDFKGERTVFQAIQAYKLAFLCGTIKKEKNVAIAGLTLRLAWLYRSLNNSGQEERFMKLARDYYMESYSTEDYSSTQMSAVRIMYMIAELSRRIGDIENATRFFSRVIEKQSVGGEAKIIDMAKEQWAIIREEKEHARHV